MIVVHHNFCGMFYFKDTFKVIAITESKRHTFAKQYHIDAIHIYR